MPKHYFLRTQLQLIFLAMIALSTAACSGSRIELQDPSGMNWEIKDGKGFCFQYNDNCQYPGGKSYHVIATTGWVDGVALVSACECKTDKPACECDIKNASQALVSESGEILVPFGKYFFEGWWTYDIEQHNGALLEKQMKDFKHVYYELRPAYAKNKHFPLWAKVFEQEPQRLKIATDLFRDQRLLVWSREKRAYGFIDKTGELVIDAQFDAATRFSKGSALVLKGEAFGSIKANGEFEHDLTPCSISLGNEIVAVNLTGKIRHIALDMRMERLTFMNTELEKARENRETRPLGSKVCSGGKWLVFTKNGAELKQIGSYNDVQALESEGFFVVKDDDYGIVDKNGNEILPTQFATIEEISTHRMFAAKRAGEEYQLFDANGKAMNFPQVESYVFSKNGFTFKKNGKWGMATLDGVISQEAIYDTLWIKYMDKEETLINDEEPYYIVKNGKWGIQDHLGHLIAPTIYDEIKRLSPLSYVRKGQEWGVLDANGSLIVPIKYDHINPFESGRASVWIGEISTYVYQNDEAQQMWADKERRDEIERQHRAEQEALQEQRRWLQQRQEVQDDIDNISQKISNITRKINVIDGNIRDDYASAYDLEKRRNFMVELKDLQRRLKEKERQRHDIAIGY